MNPQNNAPQQGAAIGARIRQTRLRRGLRQADLAARAGISASYLNLIEHERRRIGGRILLRLAAELEVEPSLLTQGAEAALLEGLREAAGDAAGAERASPQDFAGRFPGWAQLLVDTHRRMTGLERSVSALTDRLAHDPHLAESLHEVLSVVTAIRSTASILTDTPELEPEWQLRFHRNLGEDSRRLAEGAKALVRYLDRAPGSEADIKSPQDELDIFLAENGYHFAAIEDGSATIDDILADDRVLTQPAARQLAETFLGQYRDDMQRLPLAAVLDGLAQTGPDPLALGAVLQDDLPRVFRRLAFLPAEAAGPLGLAVADASGALLIRKPLDGFALTRMTGACPLWPLFRAAAQPGLPLRLRLIQQGRDAQPVIAWAVSERIGGLHANLPPPWRAYMLLIPDADPEPPDSAVPVGVSCRICARADCPARREPSVMQEGGAPA